MQKYWQDFDELVELLKTENHHAVAEELGKAKRHVNGMTDGWFDFLEGFEKAIGQNGSLLNDREKEMAYALLRSLRDALSRR